MVAEHASGPGHAAPRPAGPSRASTRHLRLTRRLLLLLLLLLLMLVVVIVRLVGVDRANLQPHVSVS